MAKVVGLRCLRCDAQYPADRYADDCPACRRQAPSNLVVDYGDALRVTRPKPGPSAGRGLWRYGDVLPVAEPDAVSLGEGGSPLHRLERAGEALGLATLYGKDESRNPTWSFKDRLVCLAISWAKSIGAKAIVSSSSGNAGAAAAAYAAKAGIPCYVFVVKNSAGPMVTQMRAYGATVIEVETKADRWTLMEHAVRHYGWFPTSPFFGPVGSNPFGIDGYKTLAYEVAEALDWRVPDCCVLPVCYGDALIGMWRGFEDMMAFGWTDRMPRMMAAEIYGSLSDAIETGGDVLRDMPKSYDTVAGSITATRGTFQALDIVRRSDGAATRVADDDIMRWQGFLAREEGLYVEPACAAALGGIEALMASGKIAKGERVVALLTASGLKDPDRTAALLEPPLRMPADTDAAISMLVSQGIFPRSS